MKKQKLQIYFDALNEANIVTDCDLDQHTLQTDIDCVSYDNRNLTGKSLFICKGIHFKDKFAFQAVERGAVCCIADKKIEGLKNCIIVNDIRKATTTCAQVYYENAQEKVKTVGITGTKGKGCVLYMLRAILNDYLKSQGKGECAFSSSIDVFDGFKKYESVNTTPEPLDLYDIFYNAWKSNTEYAVMEISSTGLKNRRTAGLTYDVACFNNFGKDHISDIEHPDMDDYFKSKLMIFDTAKVGVVNLDSMRGDEIYDYAKEHCKVITFSTKKDADVRASNIRACGNHVEFHLDCPNFSTEIYLSMAGVFNASNALAAIAMALALNVPQENIVEGLKHVAIPGRMHFYNSEDGKLIVLVDYAHNEMSFKALFASLKKQYPDVDIVACFGSSGGKALDRRPLLSKIASQYCKHVVICEDDLGHEPFDHIADELVSYLTIDDYAVIQDRGKALKHAIFDWHTDNVKLVALLGKGNESSILRGIDHVPTMCDEDLAEKYMKIYNFQH